MPRKLKLEDEDVPAAEEALLAVVEEAKDYRTPAMIEKQWAKGQSGNPAGRTRMPDDGLTAMLAWVISKEKSKLLAQTLLNKALEGDLKAIMYIYDRLEGKPRQSVIDETPELDPVLMIFEGLRDDGHALEGKNVKILTEANS